MTFEEWWKDCMGWIEYEPDQYNKGMAKAAWDYQQKKIDKLNNALTACVDAVENTAWGWDGDCGCIREINNIVDTAQEKE